MALMGPQCLDARDMSESPLCSNVSLPKNTGAGITFSPQEVSEHPTGPEIHFQEQRR